MSKRRAGFLLVDVLVAVVILMVGLVSMSAYFIQSTKTTHFNDCRTRAIQFAHEQMGLLAQRDGMVRFSDLQQSNWLTVDATLAEQAEQEGYTLAVNQLLDADVPKAIKNDNNQLVGVQVTVSWSEQNARTNQVVMINYFILS